MLLALAPMGEPENQENALVYSIQRAEAIATQLDRFASGYIHHLVGHFANLEYWLGEAREALAGLAGYTSRFRRLHAAQTRWLEDHGAHVEGVCPLCRGPCELGPLPPDPPRRVPHRARYAAERRVRDAAYGFLRRCYRAGLLEQDAFRVACASVGTNVDVADL